MATDKAVETSINIPDTKSKSKGKAPLFVSSNGGVEPPQRRGVKKGLAIGDFILRLCAMGATIGAAVTVGSAQQTLPFFTQFFQFQAQYNDIPTLVFFMIANAIVTGYLVLSLPFSIICIIRPFATTPRLLLVIFDAAMAGLTIAAASATASIIYLAHNGNPNTNWLPFCQQFGDFCQSVSGAVVGSLIAGALLLFMLILSAFSLKRS
ncbi:Casparian strip membrane protein 3 [Hibiscus syriacus]|uniref:CASP-like protein n=1 Tax=Hibiscus syriacus TaxID=106335 RepID=A0A6A2Y947_HIBSY|nr:casparian strip membrane protein 1-like [Hibiscus syriacus]KAE8673656.1 Casparian strip membrane protein 3 [Hibiscus syriacus]